MTSLKAIIIEDDINSARVLAHLLSKQSIETKIISDVVHLEQYITEDMDIVFVDLEMPGKSGYDVLLALLDEPHYRNVPIVASSVHSSELNKVREAGFHSFIGKPLAKDEFPHQLQRILSGENVWEI